MKDLAIWGAVAVLSGVAVRVVRRVALKNALLDQPNERSSHKQPVPRLGGAAFMPVVLLALGFLAPMAHVPLLVVAAFVGGAVALFAVSLADDFLTLSTTVRFAVQSVAGGGFLATALSAWPADAVSGFGISVSIIASDSGAVVPWSLGLLVLWSLLTIWIVGTLNIYNFMDGIDGIAGVQAGIAGVAWVLYGSALDAPFITAVGAFVAAGAVGFLTFNWPPAKIFMGDAGSTVLGYFFAVMPLMIVVETKQALVIDRALTAGALVLWPFLVDGIFTIFRRIRNRENILKAHRSHLYQRLVIAGKSHLQVTLIYGVLAVEGALLGWRVLIGAPLAIEGAVVGVGVSFLLLWRWVVSTERRQALSGG